MPSKAVVIFKAIDKLFNPSQNRRRLTKEYSKDIKVDYNISYDKDKACTLDTYVKPCNKNKYPVLFYVHGGGFTAGDKKYRRTLAYWYAQNGFFVINVNHGLAPEYKFPSPLQQLVSALNWVVDNAEKYNLDINNIIASGDSAGAYFASLLAVTCTNENLQKSFKVKPKIRFCGIILNCGIYDLKNALSKKVLFNLTESVLYDFTNVKLVDIDKYEYIDTCSSLSFVDENFPKTFVTYAVKDFFCGGQGEGLIEKLKEHNVYYESYGSTKFLDNHTFSLTWNSKAAKENNEKTMSFATRLVKGEIK